MQSSQNLQLQILIDYCWNCNYFNVSSSNGLKNYSQGSETFILCIHRETRNQKKKPCIWLQNLATLPPKFTSLINQQFGSLRIQQDWILNSYSKCTGKHTVFVSTSSSISFFHARKSLFTTLRRFHGNA